MSQLTAMFKKEWMESIRQFKTAALVIVLIIFGIISPLTALLMPDIMEMVMEDSGVHFELPAVQAVDSYMQFFSNLNQMGLVILVIVLGSTLTNEISRHTLINLVTKGLKRRTVIFVKYFYACLVWTVGYVMSAVITYLYTIYYWDNDVPHVLLSFSLTWLFGIFLISIIMLASSIFKSSYIAVLMTVLAVVVVMIALSIHPGLSEYMPQYLLGGSTGLLNGSLQPEDVFPAVTVTVLTSILMFVSSVFIFDKAEI